jgi:hypothetical protein
MRSVLIRKGNNTRRGLKDRLGQATKGVRKDERKMW